MGKPTEKQQQKSPAAHLKEHQFKKGQSGNPKGRPPKELCLTSLLKEELEEILKTTEGKAMTHARAFAKAWVRKAIKGEGLAFKELLERIEGKVPLPLEHGGKGGGAIKVTVALTDKPKPSGGNGNGGGNGHG